jgi:hypothetical protein
LIHTTIQRDASDVESVASVVAVFNSVTPVKFVAAVVARCGFDVRHQTTSIV